MQILRIAVPPLVSAVLLGLLAYIIDIGAAGRQLASMSPAWAAGAVLAMLANIVFASCRYRLVVRDLEGMRPKFAAVFKINLLSLFLAQVLPAPIFADVVRGAASWRLLGLGPGAAAASIVHDRLLALLGTVFCLALALPLLLRFAVERQVVAVSIAIVAGTMVSVLIGAVLIRAGGLPSNSILQRARSYSMRFASHFADSKDLLAQAALAIAGNASFAVQLWMLARGLDVPLSLAAAWAFAPAIYLAQVVPFVYAGFGAREAVSVAIMTGTGYATPEGAVAIGLAVGLTNILVSVPGALMLRPFLNSWTSRRR